MPAEGPQRGRPCGICRKASALIGLIHQTGGRQRPPRQTSWRSSAHDLPRPSFASSKYLHATDFSTNRRLCPRRLKIALDQRLVANRCVRNRSRLIRLPPPPFPSWRIPDSFPDIERIPGVVFGLGAEQARQAGSSCSRQKIALFTASDSFTRHNIKSTVRDSLEPVCAHHRAARTGRHIGAPTSPPWCFCPMKDA